MHDKTCKILRHELYLDIRGIRSLDIDWYQGSLYFIKQKAYVGSINKKD